MEEWNVEVYLDQKFSLFWYFPNAMIRSAQIRKPSVAQKFEEW